MLLLSLIYLILRYDLENNWQNGLYKTLREADISIFSYVPDAGHKILINEAIRDKNVIAISLSSEQEGIGIAAGFLFRWEKISAINAK